MKRTSRKLEEEQIDPLERPDEEAIKHHRHGGARDEL
jgi:hypothetical protein